MATKKQKRERAITKHIAFMTEVQQSGLQAQRRDREYRARKAAKAKQEEEAAEKRALASTGVKKVRGRKKKTA